MEGDLKNGLHSPHRNPLQNSTLSRLPTDPVYQFFGRAPQVH